MVSIVPADCSESLSFRAAGRRAGCSHVAISKAVQRGHLAQLLDGNVATAAVDMWNANRRAPRGGVNRAADRQTVTTPRPPKTTAPPRGDGNAFVPSEAATIAVALESGAMSLAVILCRTLPRQTALAIVAEWVEAELGGWLGGGDIPEKCTPAWDWPPPPGGGAWRDHALFKGIGHPDGGWPDLDAETAAWRAVHPVPEQ